MTVGGLLSEAVYSCQRMRDWGKNDRTQSVKGRGHTARKTSPVGEQFHACVDCGAVRQSEAKICNTY